MDSFDGQPAQQWLFRVACGWLLASFRSFTHSQSFGLVIPEFTTETLTALPGTVAGYALSHPEADDG